MKKINNQLRFSKFVENYHDPNGQITQNLLRMQEQFRQFELKFLEFYEWLPYDHNSWQFYSPKLSSLLSDVGPQLLGMFDLMCQQLQKNPNGDHFPDYFQSLNQNHMLSTQSFILAKGNQKRSPFVFSGNVPKWWTAYNDIKHNQPDGEYQGTLENTIDALGALYILHHIADVIQTDHKIGPKFQGDFSDSNNWIRVHSVGNYIKYQDKSSKNTILYECFGSRIFVIAKRYFPPLRGIEIVDPKP